MNRGVSIIICCYNSSELLPDTLDHISRLKIPQGFQAEVIIIDNNSTDNTSSLAEVILKSPEFKFEYKILNEPKQGLSSARFKGLKNSDFEYIIFCDDDNHLHPDFLEISCRIMDDNPGTAILGGESIAVSDSEFPSWFDKFSRSYAAGKQYDADGNVTNRGAEIWGAGMVLRRRALEYIFSKGFRSILNDRTSDKLYSGGDIELCFALKLAGWEIRYESSMRLNHFIHGKKLNWKYLRNLSRGFGAQKAYLDAYSGSGSASPKRSWKEEAYEQIRKLRRTGFIKAIGLNFLKEGNPDTLKIEKILGKLFELMKIRGRYSEYAANIDSAVWNRSKDNK